MSKQGNGKALVVAMLTLAIVACLGTVWNYSRYHRATRDAALHQDETGTWVSARFSHPDILRVGQRAIVTFDPEPRVRHIGRVDAIEADTSVRIGFQEVPVFPPQTRASVSVDAAVPPDS